MNDQPSADSSRSAELLLGANGTGGKEVYEYTPDPGSVVLHAGSSNDGFDRDAYRLTRGAKEIDDTEVSPATAYEFFRGKTYKSTIFRNGFAARRGWGASDSGTLEVRGQRTLCYALKCGRISESESMSSSVSEFPDGSSFETPIGRLKRLQGEVEDMLDFVSSFLVEERVPISEQSEAESASSQRVPTPGEPKDESEHSKHLGTLQVHYQARRLPPAAQEALFFGRDPLALIEELKKLRMQVSSILSDKRTEALVSHIEPVSGMRSGVALLQQHLSAASAHLQQTLDNEAKGTSTLPSSIPQDVTAAAAAVTDSHKEASGSGADDGAKGSLTTAYEVYCVPSLSPMMEQSRITTLERRLALVENKIGLHKMSLLPHADLFEAVNEMQQRIKLLDNQKIESLQKRVQGLLLELHALQQRRHELDMAAEGVSAVTTSAALPAGEEPVKGLPGSHSPSSDWQRVEELYDICERFKAPAAVLPSVLQRLKLLKGIHQEAGGVAVRLSVLEKQQEELQTWVRKADEAVNQLQKTVLESISWAQRTVAQMQQRLAAAESSTTETV
ncbi:GE19232, related [Eimeria tenella]|uniref:GE19232, related n=1 Tax=Eimeria tenella TaxID=5802 RepID=U6KYG8_EIMTE|nr:GE19232, related [Eimeria tenella]CDJ40535.1 GE19232, related [Eimeria tenella]|eukprot:XP_013231285.1 GE19232, related [Eimeria tenella]